MQSCLFAWWPNAEDVPGIASELQRRKTVHKQASKRPKMCSEIVYLDTYTTMVGTLRSKHRPAYRSTLARVLTHHLQWLRVAMKMLLSHSQASWCKLGPPSQFILNIMIRRTLSLFCLRSQTATLSLMIADHGHES